MSRRRGGSHPLRCFCRWEATASRVRPAAAGPMCSNIAAGAAIGPIASAASKNALCSCGVHFCSTMRLQ